MKASKKILLRSAGFSPLPFAGLGASAAEYLAAKSETNEAFHRLSDALEAQKIQPPEKAALITPLRRAVRKRTRFSASDELKAEFPNIFQLLEDYQFKLQKFQRVKELFFREFEAQSIEEFRNLQKIAVDTDFQTALLYAAPDLFANLHRLITTAPEEFRKKERQIALSVYQYYTRATYKTSPFSRFTVYSVWNSERVAPEEEFSEKKITVSPFVGLLPLLYEVLLKEPEFYQSLSLRLNPAVLSAEKPVKWLYYDGEQEVIQEAEGDIFTLLAHLLKNTPVTFGQLFQDLSRRLPENPEQEIEDLIMELTEVGFLEWIFPEPGMSAGWAAGLYKYLSFLPRKSHAIDDTLILLQWISGAARGLPFRMPESAAEIMSEARQKMMDYFGRHRQEFQEFDFTRIFYEDVLDNRRVDFSEQELLHIGAQIAHYWRNREFVSVYGARSQTLGLAREIIPEGGKMPFLTFGEAIISRKPEPFPCRLPPWEGPVGASLQFFREKGRLRAVVNALYPGGGKLWARLAHLLPASYRTEAPLAFPWQNWTNANFQPLSRRAKLAVPGDRLGAAEKTYALSDLMIGRKNDLFYLFDGPGGDPINLVDLGLETPESRPPLMQVLWHFGTPYVSLQSTNAGAGEWKEVFTGVHRQERLEYMDLVIARARWQIQASFWEYRETAFGPEEFIRLYETLENIGVPARFFALGKEANASPQYFFRGSPLSMRLFFKSFVSGQKDVLISEMLPLPEAWVVSDTEERRYAGEWVMECDRASEAPQSIKSDF